MNAAVTRITLNGKTGDPSAAAEWIRALNNEKILIEKSGFVFKASFDGGHLMLEVAPVMINGQRNYHFNMHLAKEDAFTLIGDVNAQGVFNILFKPESREQIAAQAGEFIAVFRRFAAFLRDSGYRGDGPLDEVTRGVLKSLGLRPPPSSLAELDGARL